MTRTPGFLDSDSFRRITPPSQRRAIEQRRSRGGSVGRGTSSDPVREPTQEERRAQQLRQLQRELEDTGSRLTEREAQSILDGRPVDEVRAAIAQRQETTPSRSRTTFTVDDRQVLAAGSAGADSLFQRRIASGDFQQALDSDRRAQEAASVQRFATQSSLGGVSLVSDRRAAVTQTGEFVGGVDTEQGQRLVTPVGRDVTPTMEVGFSAQRERGFMERLRRSYIETRLSGRSTSLRGQMIGGPGRFVSEREITDNLQGRVARGDAARDAIIDFTGSGPVRRFGAELVSDTVSFPEETALSFGTGSAAGALLVRGASAAAVRLGGTRLGQLVTRSGISGTAGELGVVSTAGSLVVDPEGTARATPFLLGAGVGAGVGARTTFPQERVIRFGTPAGTSQARITRSGAAASSVQEVPATVRVDRGLGGVSEVDTTAFVSTTAVRTTPTRVTGARATSDGVVVRRQPVSDVTQDLTIDQVTAVQMPSGRTQFFEQRFDGFSVPSTGFAAGMTAPRGFIRSRDVFVAQVQDTQPLAQVGDEQFFRSSTQFVTARSSLFGVSDVQTSRVTGVSELMPFQQFRVAAPRGVVAPEDTLVAGEQFIASRDVFRGVGPRPAQTPPRQFIDSSIPDASPTRRAFWQPESIRQSGVAQVDFGSSVGLVGGRRGQTSLDPFVGVASAVQSRTASSQLGRFVTPQPRTSPGVVGARLPVRAPRAGTSIRASPLTGVSTGSAVASGLLSSPRNVPALDTASFTRFDTRAGTDLFQQPRTGQGQITQQRTGSIQAPNTRLITPPPPPPPPPTRRTPPPPPPPIIGFDIPGTPQTQRIPGSARGARGFEFRPSVAAAQFDIRAQQEIEVVTGFEVRPLVNNRNRR